MKGKDLIQFIVVIIISFIANNYFFDKSYDRYSDIITFLSIMIGFKITSLSILFNSPLKKALYDRENTEYRTELHRLKDFYKHSLYFEVVAVTVLFLTPDNWKFVFILPIIFGTVFCFYKTTQELLRIFVYPTND